DAGIPKKRNLDPVPVITLGPNDVSVLDQANGYATIAAQGERAQPYLVARVETHSGDVVYKATKHLSHVFDAGVMADATYAMTKVLDCSAGGTACGRALTGRPAAGKTGTNGAPPPATGNLDAWFVGFTPQLSTAVWYGNTDRHKPVTQDGVSMYGANAPAETWQAMMNAALANQPVESFPPPVYGGTSQGNATLPPTASTSATPSGSTSPGVVPTATPTGGPTILSPAPTPTRSPAPTPTQSPGGAGSPAAETTRTP